MTGRRVAAPAARTAGLPAEVGEPGFVRRRPGPRSWLVLAIVVVIVATWCVGWIRYSATWSEPVLLPTEPGAPVQITDAEVRLLGIDQRAELQTLFGTETEPGSMYVVATFEIRPTGPEPDCLFHLVFDNRQAAAPTAQVPITQRDAQSSCFDLPPNVPTRVEAIWSVPQDSTDHILGLGYSRGLGRMTLLRPAG